MINFQSHHWSIRFLKHILSLSLAFILSGPLAGLSMAIIVNFFSKTPQDANIVGGVLMMSFAIIIFELVLILPLALPLLIIFVWRKYHRLSSYILSALACAAPVILLVSIREWGSVSGLILTASLLMIAALGGWLVWILAGRFNRPPHSTKSILTAL